VTGGIIRCLAKRHTDDHQRKAKLEFPTNHEVEKRKQRLPGHKRK
jgi:hypothetical protein